MNRMTQRIAELSPEQLEKLAQRLKARKKPNVRTAHPAEPPSIPKRGAAKPPLSFAQRRLWFLDQLNPGSFNYNIPIAMDLRQLPSVPVLERCIGALVRRHETLRTTFDREAGEPVQVIADPGRCEIQVVDLGGLDAGSGKTASAELKTGEAARPFDLRTGPLVRLFLILDHGPCLIFNIHHIISDVWSMGVVLREMGMLYRAFSEGKPNPLPPLSIQYADWSLWQHRYFASGALTADLAFWRENLADAPPLLTFPTGRPLPPVQRYRGTRRHFGYPKDLSDRLRRLVRERNATMFMVMLAAYSTLLHRYTGERDLLLGSTFSGRDREETAGLVGFFVNTLPLRIRIAGNPRFGELLEQVKETVLAVIAHERVPFEKIVENLKIPRHRSYSPVFQNVFAYNDFPAYETEHGGLIRRVEEIDNGGTPFNLVLFVTHTNQGLVGSVRYNTDLYDGPLIERMIGHFEHVLHAVAHDPQARVAGIPVMDRAELRRQCEVWQGVPAPDPPGGTIAELFERQSRATPEAIAIRAENRFLSYAGLAAAAADIGALLQEQGFSPGRVAGIELARSPELVASMLGVLATGGAYLALDPEHPRERIATMLADAGADFLVCRGEETPGFKGVRLAPPTGATGMTRARRSKPMPGLAPAYIMYTSGSTGKPKGVVISRDALCNYAQWAAREYLRDGVRVLPLFSSVAFDLTLTSIFVPLIAAGTVAVYGEGARGEPPAVLRVFAEDRVDLVKLTPSHLALVRDLDLTGSHVRTLILGGEELKASLAHELHSRFQGKLKIYNEYGPTETVVGCMIHRFRPLSENRGSVPIGRPAAGSRIYVVDPDLNPRPRGLAGELFIGGMGLTQGYHARPDLTAKALLPNPFGTGERLYRSGDHAVLLESEDLLYLGRRDAQVKIRGTRLEPGEVEAALAAHPHIHACAVVVQDVRKGRTETDRTGENILYCARCGIPSNFPEILFNDHDICSMCISYERYKDQVANFFGTVADLERILSRAKKRKTGNYDCLMLLSGGKDSTYALFRIVEMGAKVLAFTLDNGFISEGAKANIRRAVKALHVDLVVGRTPAMNRIFVDSLQRFDNVCNGCFKTIYTMGMNLAHEKGIKTIVTGLSRGQLFETRLAQLYENGVFDVDQIEQTIVDARKVYHRVPDAVTQALDHQIFQDDRVFEEIQYVDFYRYCNVSLDELYAYLAAHAPWVRPTDTGRSTNCLINEAGIFLHKRNRGYHNYAFPYCWDVRLGHKTREAALAELDDPIDETRVADLLTEIGYREETEAAGSHLVAYYVSDQPVTVSALRAWLADRLPDAMIPTVFSRLEALPLALSGKVDRARLPALDRNRPELDTAYAPPRGPVEEKVAAVLGQTLRLDQVGRHDNFFELGGHSMLATQLIFQLRETFEVELQLQSLFAAPTAAGLAELVVNAKQGQGEYEPLPLLVSDATQRGEPFPLTDVQQAYWIGRREGFELGNVSAHGYSELDFEHLDIEGFERALQALIERHGMLRAVILEDGRQRVFAEVPPYRPLILDLKQTPERVKDKCLEEIRDAMSHQVLAGDRWPIFDIRASLLTETLTRLHLSVDALISDAWSFRILIGELVRLYRNPEQPLEPLALGFRDYVLAERALRRTAHYRRARDYWLERVPNLPPGPALPIAQSPATMERPRFERLSGMLDRDQWSKLQKQAVRKGLTPSGTLLAAFAEVLARWSKTPRFTINLTLFNRLPLHPNVNRIVGDFTSINLLEVDFAGNDPFGKRARRLQERLWKDLDHRYFSGVQVQQELAKSRPTVPGVAMPVVFTSTLGMNPAKRDHRPDAMSRVRVRYSISQTPQVLLDHQVSEEDGVLYFNWDTVRDVYPEGMLTAMFQCYRELLQRLCEGSWHELQPARLPKDQECRRLAVNRTEGPLPGEMLHELFAARARGGPDAPALIGGRGTLTYGGLDRRARALGRMLRRHGAGPNQLIAVLMEKGPEQVIAVLATHFAGAAYLPIEASLPRDRIAYLLDRGRAAIVLTQSWSAPGFDPDPSRTRIDIDLLPDQTQAAVEDEPARRTPDDLAYVIFTSGSTGKPKGVTLSHRGPANTITDINRRFGVGAKDRVLAISSLSFDLSVYDIFGILAAGGALVMPSPSDLRDPARWSDLMAWHGISLWNSVPALMKLLVEYATDRRRRLAKDLRLVMLSGDWIPVSLPDQIRGLADGVSVIGMGGATEASIWSIIYPIGEVPSHWTSIPYGKPMANQCLYVLGPRLESRPDWVPGELFIGGEGIALRYWRDPEKTACSFLAHPETGQRMYRTGDLGRFLPDGNIEFLGRDDFQVKVQGYRIELGEIEVALAKHPRIRTAIATATGPRDNRRLSAFIVLASGDDPGTAEWRGFLRKTLPDYMIPSHFSILESLPLTANGKVDRNALHQIKPAPIRGLRPKASTPLEEVLCELWAQLLDLDEVKGDESFFELGGNSLVAIRLIAKLQELFEVKVALPRFFENPTVEGLVEIIEAQRENGPAPEHRADALPAIVPDGANRYQPFPLTDIQQAYWVGRQGAMSLGNIATHSYREIDFEGLDLERLEDAFRQLIRRHDMLRMVVNRDGTQQILERVPAYRIECRDLSGLDPRHAHKELEATRHRMSHQVFQTGKWPLFEVRAHLLPGRAIRVHIGVDLLIADARSFQMLQDEWFLRCANPNLPQEPLALSFRDYVLAERRARESAVYRRAEAYWNDRLSTMPPAPKLALAKPIHLLRSPKFSRRKARLDAETWQRLKRRGSRAGLSPSGLLSGAFAETLAQWSASPRFTINLTTFNRLPLHDHMEQLVGDFTSTTLLAVDCTQATFEERAGRIQERIWHDLEHRMFSGIEVMRALRRQTRGAAGVMPVVFTSNLVHGPANGGSADVPWRARTAYSISQTPQVLLDHQATELAGELLFNWDYLAEAFHQGYMESMFTAFCDLLKKLSDREEAWVESL